MPVITLTTDFGSADYGAGILKGVIWNIAPKVQIADLTHDISPQDIMEGALVLWRCTPYFPDGTVHVAVVDPGVGTPRRGIAAQIGEQYYVGPDNGLFSMVLARAEASGQSTRFIHLDNRSYWLDEVTSVFHGRDVFSPVAAYLASGTALDAFGPTIHDPIRLNIPVPFRSRHGWMGKVIHIDHFGNLATNISSDHIGDPEKVIIRVNDERIHGLVATFGERPAGTLVGLIDSSNSLAISVVNGSAAAFLNAHKGDDVEIIEQQ
jgi:S-adenosyl-L-methionine hydrolase (adenosine-forming)